jgi:hypothetical protein
VTWTSDYPVKKVFLSVLAVTGAVLLAVWVAAPSASSNNPAPSGPIDLSDATFVEIRTLDGRVVMSGELRNHVNALGGIEKDAALLGPQQQRVVGEIEIEIPRPNSPDPRQELEVDIISLQPRTTYDVVVNDRPALRFTTDDRGSVDLEVSHTIR